MHRMIPFILLAWFGPAACGGRPAYPAPVATEAGVTAGAPTLATVGAAGARVSSSDGRLHLAIPAGALGVPTVLTIQPVTNTAHGGMGLAYQLLPENQTFAKPVSLVFTWTDADIQGSAAEALVAVTRTRDGYWRRLDSAVDASAKTVTTTSTHFSAYSLARFLQIEPAGATVMTSRAVTFVVMLAYPLEVTTGRESDRYGLGWMPATMAAGYFTGWAVEEVIGGNATLGTIDGRAERAVYTAPARRPPSGRVRVNVRLGGLIVSQLIANVAITGVPPSYGGSYSVDSMTTTSTSTEAVRVSGTMTLTRQGGGPAVYSWDRGSAGRVMGTITSYTYDHTLYRCVSDSTPALDPLSSATLWMQIDPRTSALTTNLIASIPVTCTPKDGSPPFRKTTVLTVQVGSPTAADCQRLEAKERAPDFPDSLGGVANYRDCQTPLGRQSATVSWNFAGGG